MEMLFNRNSSVRYALDAISSFVRIPDAEAGITTTTKTTKFIGSLYEETSGAASRHIFLGDTEIASITGGQTLYYHADHLGGMNVLTDSNGRKKVPGTKKGDR